VHEIIKKTTDILAGGYCKPYWRMYFLFRGLLDI